MMTSPNNLTAYADVLERLKECRAAGGARLTFDTEAQATVWRARAYKYRTLLRQRGAVGMPEGFLPSTEWDDMLIQKTERTLTVKFGQNTQGVLEPLGEPLRAAAHDDILAAIATIAAKEGQK